MKSKDKKHQPACLLAHDLVNRLSAIIGCCDLLIEKAEPQGDGCMKQLVAIKDLAESAVKTLAEHQCELSVVMRRSEPQKYFLT